MKKQMKGILSTLIVLSLVVSALIGNLRIQQESSYNEVQVAIHYSHVLDIARQLNQTVEEVLAKYKGLGANTLFVRENTVAPIGQGDLANLQEQGKAVVRQGYDLQLLYPEETAIKGQFQYIKTSDLDIYNLIYDNLSQKGVGINEVSIGEELYLEVTSSYTTLVTVGVGFNTEDLQIAADLGYVISPQVKSWSKPSDEAITFVVEQIEAIPSLGTIYFADTDIPGYDHQDMIALIEAHGLGYIEFFSSKQKGFNTLAKNASNNGSEFDVVRLHTLNDGEVKTYTHQETLDRFNLALAERNIRVFLFKMPNTLNIVEDELFLEESIINFTRSLEQSKFTLASEIQPLNLPQHDFLMVLATGVAAILVFVLLADYIGFTRTGYILGILGFIGYAGLLKLVPSLAIKLMALFGAIIFPTYGGVKMMETKPGSYKDAIIGFIKMSIISFGGALTIVGTLSSTAYSIGLDIFTGVTVANLVPIGLVIIILYYKRHGLNIQYYKELLNKNINYFAVVLIGIGAVALMIFTSRSGNTGSISELEQMFRQLLDTILGVRPRTKEFLIGHPIMITLLYFGYQERYLLLLILGMIGQASLVNTYAHLHTPIQISLIRSGYGIFFGIIIGVLMIAIIKMVIKVVSQWMLKKQ